MQEEKEKWVELSPYGLARRNGGPEEHFFLLGDLRGDYVVSIPISESEKETIGYIEDPEKMRYSPSVMDVVGGLIRGFSIRVGNVHIVENRNRVFRAEIIFENDSRRVALETSVMVALVVAIRMGLKIYISQGLFSRVGERYTKEENGKECRFLIHQTPAIREGLVRHLEEELEEAVRNEEYERAGELKVKINNIKNTNN
ncbi:MAG TPA: hypothetical protein DDY68_05645 [Porphyromonadaceae bacterium]|nr:hypothetical protein [Porphyromonadaceae bacterium]